jgi:DNA-directed RNA polymerase
MSHQLEYALETQALDDGKARYFKKLEISTKGKAILDRSDLRLLLRQALPLVSVAVRSKLGEERKGRHSTASQVLQNLDPDLIALAGLSATFRVVSQSKPMASVCRNIGSVIDDELFAANLHKADAKLSKRLVTKAKKSHNNIGYRRKAVKATAAKEGFATAILPEDEKVKVGAYVLDCILKAVPEIFEDFTIKSADKEQNFLRLTEAASQSLLDAREVQSWMHPAYKPMVVPPKPWTDFNTGCYHNPKLARTVTLVRTSDPAQIALIRKAIRAGTLQYGLEALNAIQNTRLVINAPVHHLVTWAYDSGLDLPSFPARTHIPKPPRPENYTEMDEQSQKGWRIQAAQVAEKNRAIDGDRMVMLQDLLVAESLLTAKEFYIPHNMDFRGRVYPVSHFNQQRADHIKAQMHFAEGRVLTQSGVYWLAVHLANCGDFNKISKQPFDARVQWVADNEEMIFQIARDPQAAVSLWKEADKPFSFVAACMEWYGYRMDPESFKSHLAVALDGSNSGLQHYSCMMLSASEGALVNLQPSDKPADLYQTVADRVKAQAEADALDGLEVAKVVLENGIDRKLCKRATMTFAYSSQEYGFREQLMDDVMRPLALKVLTKQVVAHPYAMLRTDKEGNTRMDGGFTAASYIAKLIWKAVNEIVTDACHGMAFFRRCAQLLAHEGKGLVWVTPIGLPVLHLYPEYKMKKVRLFLHDREVRLFTRTGTTGAVNKAKAADAVSPNVVHSLDSAALMLCVLECVDQGVKDFSLIHDSFGAHPNDTEIMYTAVRQSLTNMYEAYCPFEEIRSQTLAAIDAKDKVPAVPTKGNLDLSQIIDAEYAFA